MTLLLLACAAAMGFLVPRGTTCAVAAVSEVFDRRSAWRFAGFGMATCAGIAILLPLSWALGFPLHFAAHFALSGTIALGGLLFGLGAGINGACVFGTLTKIVSGDSSYMFVLLGLWLGGIVLGLTHVSMAPQILSASHLSDPSPALGLIWALAILFLMGGGVLFARQRILRFALIMSGIGLVGGLLYTLHPSWSYSSLVHEFAQETIMMPPFMRDSLLPCLVVAAGVGGFVSVALAGRFKLKAPTLQTSIGAIIGGFLMAFGITMIPGGNDSIVLFLLPSLVPAGLLAYATMNMGIAVIVLAGRAIAKTSKGGLA